MQAGKDNWLAPCWGHVSLFLPKLLAQLTEPLGRQSGGVAAKRTPPRVIMGKLHVQSEPDVFNCEVNILLDKSHQIANF